MPVPHPSFNGRWTVAANGCWEWTGYIDRDGYGTFPMNRRSTKAHRYALMLATGQNPPPKVLALHSCDNRKCVNPAHLRWGTHADNTRDMYERGRHPKKRTRKIPKEKIPSIVARRSDGESYRSIAADYDVSPGAIHRVVRENN